MTSQDCRQWCGYISRKGAGHHFVTITAAQFEMMLTAYEPGAGLPMPVVSDLALGGWRTHQVASEFADQLGISLPVQPTRLPKHAGRDQRVASSFLGEAVDAETKGSPGLIVALEAANAVVSALSGGPERSFYIIVPMFGQLMGPQNIRFVEFLAEGLRDVGGSITIVMGDRDVDVLPSAWELSSSKPPIPPESFSASTTRVDARWAAVPGLVPPEMPPPPDDDGVQIVILGVCRT